MTERSCLATFALIAALAVCLFARAPARAEEQIVYWPLVTNGTEYRRIPYPQEAGPLLVLADTEFVIEAVRAPVSYWPITGEYLADLAAKPEPVAGTVEIVDAAGKVTVLAPEPYVLWYPAGVGAGPASLIRGAQAGPHYERYVTEARAAAKAAIEYQRIVAELNAAAEAWLRIAATRPKTLPPPPPQLDIDEPEPFHAFASEPRNAVIASIPGGEYTVRIRNADGDIVPGSERRLIGFAALDRGTGYVLRPENQWTRPLVSFAPEETIYTTGETDLFFQPVPVVEYPAQHFTRLFRPQSVEAADPAQTLWIPREDAGDADDDPKLTLWHGGTEIEKLPLTPYRVSQIAGAERGYTIEPFEKSAGSTLTPDFSAMRVARDSPATRLAIAGTNGSTHSGERQIRRVTLPSDPWLFLSALLPIVLGFGLRMRARLAR